MEGGASLVWCGCYLTLRVRSVLGASCFFLNNSKDRPRFLHAIKHKKAQKKRTAGYIYIAAAFFRDICRQGRTYILFVATTKLEVFWLSTIYV